MRTKTTLGMLAMVLIACGGGDDADGGPDATMDTTVPDTGKDSTVDASNDASNDATIDAADGSTNDAPSDAPTDASDAATGSDASDAASDASDASADAGLDDAGCGSKTGFSFSSVDGGCGVGVDYKCGTDTYQIECTCMPFGLCRCAKDDAGAGGPFNWAGCPSCTGTVNYSSLAMSCGIPY